MKLFMANTALGVAKRNSNFQVLIDSDAFVGWMVELDAHHQKASQVFDRLHLEDTRLVTTSLVVLETATVLSHRSGQSLAKTFLDEVIEKGQFPVIHILEDFYHQTLNIFKTQTKKGTSITDCANVAVARQFNIPTIFSFDQVYSKSFGLKMASEGY